MEFYITDRGERYLQELLEGDLESRSNSEIIREIIILQVVKAEKLDSDSQDLMSSSGLLKRTFRGLFEAGYIERVE